MTDKELQDLYLGKKIEVPYKHPMNVGSEKPTVAGICQFIGHNSVFPSWDLQVTIDRMPISNVDPLTIKIIQE